MLFIATIARVISLGVVPTLEVIIFMSSFTVMIYEQSFLSRYLKLTMFIQCENVYYFFFSFWKVVNIFFGFISVRFSESTFNYNFCRDRKKRRYQSYKPGPRYLSKIREDILCVSQRWYNPGGANVTAFNSDRTFFQDTKLDLTCA